MTITVHFTGICTHVTLSGQTGTTVVLVNAENGAFINEKKIPPHIPKLKIDPQYVDRIVGYPHGLEPTGETGVWRLAGVNLKLKGTTGEWLPDPSFEDVPHLGTVTSQPGPELSTELAISGQASCSFEVDRGRMFKEMVNEAKMSRLEVEAGESPYLEVTCVWNQQTSKIYLTPNAEIVLQHIGGQHLDSDYDFLLHYRVFRAIPDDPFVPDEPKMRRNKVPGDVSIGCSNSQFP